MVPLGIFSVPWDKKVSRESRDIPLLSINFFDKRFFLKNEGSPYEFFRYCEKINFRQNRDTPSYAIFFNPEFFWNPRVPLRIFSVLWGKISERKSWYPLPIHNFFRIKKFSEKWRVPLRIFSVLWENQFPTKSWYTILCIFFNPEIFWNKRSP